VEEPEEWVGYAHALLKRAQKHSKGRFFVEPVDPEGLGIPDYFDIIKHPMDFGTIAKKLASNEYASQDEYEADMRLIFNNAFTYNAENDDVWRAARTMSNFFEENWTKSVGAPPLLAPARSESPTPANLLETLKSRTVSPTPYTPNLLNLLEHFKPRMGIECPQKQNSI
jgi:hypothetical protein